MDNIQTALNVYNNQLEWANKLIKMRAELDEAMIAAIKSGVRPIDVSRYCRISRATIYRMLQFVPDV